MANLIKNTFIKKYFKIKKMKVNILKSLYPHFIHVLKIQGVLNLLACQKVNNVILSLN